MLISGTISAGALFAAGDEGAGARALAMGSAYVAVANTADAVFLNPGGLATLDVAQVTLFYQKPFGLRELNVGSVSLSLDLFRQRVAVGLTTLGDARFRENSLAVAYSRDWGARFFYGAALRLQQIVISGYGSAAAVGLDVGLVTKLGANTALGFAATNLNRPKLGRARETLAQTFALGVSHRPHSRLLLTSEVFKDLRFPAEWRIGLELTPAPALALRTGLASNPERFSLGFGLALAVFTVDYAFFTHTDLGLTHQFSLSAQLGTKSQTKPTRTPPVVAIKAGEPETTPPPEAEPQTRVNLNTASLEQLVALPGIGTHLAEAILAYRAKHGPFRRLEALLNVPGIGPRKLEALRPHVFVDQIAGKP